MTKYDPDCKWPNISGLMFTEQQIISEKSAGRYSDPNKECIFRLELLSDWLTLYHDYIDLKHQLVDTIENYQVAMDVLNNELLIAKKYIK
jgi:hypothetical protein